jgi:TonB family protein
MFLEYFRLREQPFGVTPDPRFLFPSPGHREALASLLYGIESNLGFGTLIAQPGMGKTTLLFHILEQYRQSARTAFIFNTQCNSYDLLRSLLSELDEDSAARDTFQLHEKFKQVLAAEAQKRRRVILVIDEAQNLGDMVMETVRLLSNFESAHLKLLHIILAGQQELAAKLSRPELNQLHQRIPILTHLPLLSPPDIAAYIEHRLRVAGYQGTPLFTPEAVRHIVWLSRGIPREINRLCFNSLSLAYASSKPIVDLTVIEEVAADLGIQGRLQARREEQADQFKKVAVNSAAAPVRPAQAPAQKPQPRPAEVWPGTNPAYTAPFQSTMANRERTAPRPVPVPNAPQTRIASPTLTPQRRWTPPSIQRIRRVSYSSSGWQVYKRPIGYAFFCLTLIAAGWTAVNRWVHPGGTANAEVQSTPDGAPEPPHNQTGTAKAASLGTTPNSPARSNFDNKHPVQSTKANAHPVQLADSLSKMHKSRRENRKQSSELLASARTSSELGQAQPPTPAPAVHSPAVREPTVADQNQMEFVKYVRPHYPEEARDRHIEGTVVLSAVVARDGTVKGVKPVSGDPALLKAAETAVRDWVYRPYQINGRPVDVDTEIVINFSLPRRPTP